jgi:SMC interacting uncharacterized protein involved in chromosome segregation
MSEREAYPVHAEGLTQEAYESLLKKAAEAARLREALQTTAERHHGLSNDPVHLRSTFSECESRECVEARQALGDTDHE